MADAPILREARDDRRVDPSALPLTARLRFAAGWAPAVLFVTVEVFGGVPIATVALCLAFGWSDLCDAWWVHRTDPDRARGRIVACGCLAVGFARVMLTTFGFMVAVLLVLIARGTERPIGDNLGSGRAAEVFGTCAFVLLASLLAATALAIATLLLALATRRRFWVGPLIGQARRDGAWPPWAVGNVRGTNHARYLAWFAVIAGAVLLVLAEMVALNVGGAQREALLVVCLILMLGSIIGVPLVALPFLDRRVVAAGPLVVWPLEPP